MKEKKKKGKIRENIESFVVAILIALFLRAFVVQAYKIPSGSMENTLLIGDYLLVTRLNYGIKIPLTDIYVVRWAKPKRGDIIVFRWPKDHSKDFIKRVIGIEGDKILIEGKKVYVNGEEVEEPYANFTDIFLYTKDHYNPGRQFFCPSTLISCNRDYYGPIIVPKGKVFVMGDNRDNSNDSRYWGFVDLNEIQGKAFIIYFSWDSNSRDIFHKIRWKRIGRLIK